MQNAVMSLPDNDQAMMQQLVSFTKSAPLKSPDAETHLAKADGALAQLSDTVTNFRSAMKRSTAKAPSGSAASRLLSRVNSLWRQQKSEKIDFTAFAQKCVEDFNKSVSDLEGGIKPLEEFVVESEETVALYKERVQSLEDYLEMNPDSGLRIMIGNHVMNLKATIVALEQDSERIGTQVKGRIAAWMALSAQAPLIQSVFRSASITAQSLEDARVAHETTEIIRDLCNDIYERNSEQTVELNAQVMRTVHSIVLDPQTLVKSNQIRIEGNKRALAEAKMLEDRHRKSLATLNQVAHETTQALLAAPKSEVRVPEGMTTA